MGDNGFLLGAGFLLRYNLNREYDDEKTILPWPYISIGYSF